MSLDRKLLTQIPIHMPNGQFSPFLRCQRDYTDREALLLAIGS